VKILIDIIAGRQIDLSNSIDLNLIKINRVWTVYDEKEMWNSCKFNPHTGLPVTSIDDLVLQHRKGVFLEDYIHDWNIRNGKLDYGSRVVEQGEPIKILIDYEIK